MTYLSHLTLPKFLATGLLFAILFPAPGAEAIVIRHDRNDSLYTDLANQPQFAPVGFLGGGSGILISPDWVVTAAHLDGSSFTVGSTSYAVSQSLAHPNWNGDLSQGYDIRLLRLATPVAGITPALIYGGNQELGLPATFVGFGATGTGLTGATQPAGTKRAAENALDAFGVPGSIANTIQVSFTGGRILLADFDAPGDPSKNVLGSPIPLDLEGTLAGGDSGGGAFVQVNGVWMLAGIHSFIADFDRDGSFNKYSDLLGITRVSSQADWIFQTTGIQAVAEPVTILGAATAAGFGAFFKRKISRNK